MYECIQRGVDYVLAGSIRDDGPLPDTVMDLTAAQDLYAVALKDVSLVLILSTHAARDRRREHAALVGAARCASTSTRPW